jgi:hypothetical protein
MTRRKTFSVTGGVTFLVGIAVQLSGFQDLRLALAVIGFALLQLTVGLFNQPLAFIRRVRISFAPESSPPPVAAALQQVPVVVKSDGLRWAWYGETDEYTGERSIRVECSRHRVPLLLQGCDGIRTLDDDDFIDEEKDRHLLCPKDELGGSSGGHVLHFASCPMTVEQARLKANLLMQAKMDLARSTA